MLKCGNCDHPSALNFMKVLKSVVNNDLLQVPFPGKCEIDESQFQDISSNLDSDTEDSFLDDLPLTEINVLVYIVG